MSTNFLSRKMLLYPDLNRIVVHKKFQLCGWGKNVVSDLPLSLEEALVPAQVQKFLFFFCILYGLSSKTLVHTSWRILSQKAGGVRT